jgi:hypothetical protein
MLSIPFTKSKLYFSLPFILLLRAQGAYAQDKRQEDIFDNMNFSTIPFVLSVGAQHRSRMDEREHMILNF